MSILLILKSIFISGLVYTTSVKLSILEEAYKKFEVFCRNNSVILIDNRNIRGPHLYRDDLHLLESGKRILSNNCITYLNKIFRTNSAPRGEYLDNAIFDDETYNLGYLDKPCDTPSILSKLKLRNVNRLGTENLNINSLPGKFDQLKVVIENNIDILIVKIDSSFSSSQFMIKGFSIPFRFDRNRSGGEVIFYVRDDIPSKQLTKHKLPDDIEGVFIEVNLRKIKWLIFDTYHPSSQPVEYFFKHVDYALDVNGQIYVKFLLASDFNTERTDALKIPKTQDA